MCLNKTGDGYGEEAGPLSIIDDLDVRGHKLAANSLSFFELSTSGRRREQERGSNRTNSV